MGQKFDVAMWTYNSESTLEQSLSSIEQAIPNSRICHRIMVDGGSSDGTEKIAREHGWDFYESSPGIPVQANFALRLVDTSIYASFEHDIVLTSSWLSRIEKQLSPPHVGVAQGVRLSKGCRPLESLERWSYNHGRLAIGFYSIDNNLYKTDIIKKVGGYPIDCPMTADGLLRRNVLAYGKQWVTDPNCVSWHLRSSFPKYISHVIRHIQSAKYLWQPENTQHLTAKLLRIFITSPVVGTRIATETFTPSLLFDYPLLRYVLLVTTSVLAGEKQVIVIPGLTDEALKA